MRAGPTRRPRAQQRVGGRLGRARHRPDLAATESLAELLERRIETAFAAAPADRLIAVALLAGLDEAGYLTVDVDARCGAARRGRRRRWSACCARCQELAPTGIFARGLAECLALQLAERNRLDPAMQALLANLERLAAGDRAGLCALCGVDRDDLDEMIAEIRALDPKPGLAFAHEPVRAARARRVRPAGAGRRLDGRAERRGAAAPHRRPRLLRDASRPAAQGEADKRYLTDCLQKASWLEKSLDQRARTVLKVASEIVRRQEGFLAEGVAMLRPLNLRMVADALGIHESTVSRAAANKTIATPRGIFEFRYFFTGAIAATSGRRGAFRRGREAPDPQADHGGIARCRAFRRRHRRAAFARRHRDRPPHGREVPRDHAHRLVRRAAPGEAAARRLLTLSRLPFARPDWV